MPDLPDRLKDYILPDRIWAKVEVGDCWEWTGAGGGGYGNTHHNGRHQRAHRVVYEALVGPIPAGLEIDHLCRNRRCVNPDHLEPVTRSENARRGLRHDTIRACPSGHPYDEQNTKWYGGRRYCRACHYRHSRNYRLRKRAAA